MKKISVIIPVYQAKEYLSDAINSVMEQDLDRIEIILVDDGSSDGSEEMCDVFARDYDNCIVIHQKNKGPGLSRNAGVKVANGEYVMFLDSDDLLDSPHVLSKMYAIAKKNNADIVQGNYRRLQGKSKRKILKHHLEGLDQKSMLFRFRGFYQYEHLSYCWGKIYRRSFLLEKNIWQRPYCFSEDKLYNLMILVNKPRYSFINECVVLYRVNTGSATFKYKQDYGNNLKKIARDFKYYLLEKCIKEDYTDMINLHYFSGACFVALQEMQGHRDKELEMAKKALQEYFSDVDARRALYGLAFERSLPLKAPLFWHVSARVSAVLLILHAYTLFALACKWTMGVRETDK